MTNDNNNQSENPSADTEANLPVEHFDMSEVAAEESAASIILSQYAASEAISIDTTTTFDAATIAITTFETQTTEEAVAPQALAPAEAETAEVEAKMPESEATEETTVKADVTETEAASELVEAETANAEAVEVEPVEAELPAALAAAAETRVTEVAEVQEELPEAESAEEVTIEVDAAKTEEATESVEAESAEAENLEIVPREQAETPAETTQQLPSTIEESQKAETAAPQSEDLDAKATDEKQKKNGSEKTLFTDFELDRRVELAVQAAGYVNPTPVQQKIIPQMLAGRDILAQSQTGTGKTAAFALPILSNLQPKARLPQALILTPTRELATQVAESFETYGANLPKLRIASIYGGTDYVGQLRALKRGVQVVVGTPGRVIDHLNRGTLQLDMLQCVVLDEADEMLNMGFQEDVEKILDQTPEEKQMTLFSATMPDAIQRIADQHLHDPYKIVVRKKQLTADSVEQRCVFIENKQKVELLARLLEVDECDGVIVFTKTKDQTISVSEHLSARGFKAAALNGDLPQARRERTVDQLKAGKINILVATDVAARGLDVQRVSHVINFDLPHDSESYVHRIGRTGRAGRSGIAYIFLNERERGKLRLIERATKKTIQIVEPPSSEQLSAARIAAFKETVLKHVDADEVELYQQILTELVNESGQDLETIAAGMAHMARGGRPLVAQPLQSPKPREKRGRERFEDGRRDRRDDRPQRGRKREGDFNRRGPRPVESGMQRFWIGVGREDGVRPGNIVGAVANEAGIPGSDIGPIQIRDHFSTIDLPAEAAQAALQTLQHTWVSGKQLKIRVFEERGNDSRTIKDRKPRKFSGGDSFARGKKPGGKKNFGKKPFAKKPSGKKSFSKKPFRKKG